MHSSSGCALEEGPSLQHQAPVPSDRAGQGLPSEAQCWGMCPSRGRAPGAQIFLLQAPAHWLGLGMYSFHPGLPSYWALLYQLLSAASARAPVRLAWSSAHLVGGWPCSAGGPGNAALPLVPSLTPWAGRTWGHPSYGGASRQRCDGGYPLLGRTLEGRRGDSSGCWSSRRASLQVGSCFLCLPGWVRAALS